MGVKRDLRHRHFLIVIISITLWFSHFTFDNIVFAEDVFKGLDVYFVRHAETVGNATGLYTEQNQRAFTEKGKGQIADLTIFLAKYKFDFICVSPKLRTLKTILPYLKKHNLTAEVWPEISECSSQKERYAAPEAKLIKGDMIVLSDDMKKYFRFGEPDMNYFYKDGNYADAILRLRKARDLIIERFGNSGKCILVVGHSMAGGRMMEILMGLEPEGRLFPGNAHLFHLQQQPDGKFRMLENNVATTSKATIKKK